MAQWWKSGCSPEDRAQMMEVVATHREARGDYSGALRARQTAEDIRTSSLQKIG